MKKIRNILLVEPNYKNKYPPIGLMKIATYHRILGDRVEFFKGDLNDFVASKLALKCIKALYRLNPSRNWEDQKENIESYIKRKRALTLGQIIYRNSPKRNRLIARLNYYNSIYRKKHFESFPKWDRIYVTSLFTFYWKITIRTIEAAKNLVYKPDQLLIGGVLGSLLHNEVEQATGIKPHRGLLDQPGILDPSNRKAKDIIIDDLPLDYSILEETEYVYPTGSAYFTFMTKGCTRKCAFCSVPILEPTYKPKIETIDKFREIKNIYGEQQHLLLMDNNVLASPNFPDIVDEIKRMGFVKGATYVEPNQLDISIGNLKNKLNDKAYTKRSQRLLAELIPKVKGTTKEKYLKILKENEVDDIKTTTKRGLINAYKDAKEIFEKYRKKTPSLRFVDFNQGTDARYVTDDLMKLMSEIPIKPLRIAFDYWGLKDIYEAAVRLAAKHRFKVLSNYILYNFHDNPDELYKRLEINININEELGTQIFSFPMKYIPLFGEEAKDRNFIGRKWNKKFIRAIQSILNVTKGIVAPGKDLFVRAFGKDLLEFNEILYMPEEYIVYRQYFDDNGHTLAWRDSFRSLTIEERSVADAIICSNDFRDYESKTSNDKILSVLDHYVIKKSIPSRVFKNDSEFKKVKRNAEKLIKNDVAVNLTITYDFEMETARRKHVAKVS
jgi:hypothetical protein